MKPQYTPINVTCRGPELGYLSHQQWITMAQYLHSYAVIKKPQCQVIDIYIPASRRVQIISGRISFSKESNYDNVMFHMKVSHLW